jgi:DinB superfamily
MEFSLDKATEILSRTPPSIRQLTLGLSPEWTNSNEGGDTWTVFDIVGHLIHGEKTDWLTRTEIILSSNSDKIFHPFDRFAQFEQFKGKNLKQLLEEFENIRKDNIEKLKKFNITEHELKKTGIHPTFGQVTLSQLLSAWVVHDLDHISQVSRVMAKQFKDQTGPWIKFLKILRQ